MLDDIDLSEKEAEKYQPQTSIKGHCEIQEEISICNQKVIPVELHSLSTVSSPGNLNNSAYLSVHVGNNSNTTRLTRVLQFFHCIAKRKLDDSKILSSYYSTMVKEPNSIELEKSDMFSELSSFNRCDSDIYKPCVSNSSLKDIEMGAIEEELTAYMKEIRNREFIS
ncbi:hypothetical protein NQ315_014449 [Exocentrus adspersus]|uniref:Uncharacterized protein n=1 Tax=Exocentrus adspersus TaxID=1586481 RepID=A0AAV8V6W4_9CUCU|nr:hypothetical protein NQ315_014449 [Exocentrus adspersus]